MIWLNSVVFVDCMLNRVAQGAALAADGAGSSCSVMYENGEFWNIPELLAWSCRGPCLWVASNGWAYLSRA